jgi:hypothetical protein
MVPTSRQWLAIAGLAGASLLVAGCGSDDDGLAVSLTEWDVEAPASVAGGSVEITAANDGGEVHELVIVRADSFDGWEQDEEGKVLEDQFAEADFIGEIEEFDAGTSESATFDLEPGTYVLFCNIVEEEADGGFESHFDEGMKTLLEVT